MTLTTMKSDLEADQEVRDIGHDAFLLRLRGEIRQVADPGEIMRVSAKLLAEHLDADRCAYANVENETTFMITGDYCRGVPSIVGRWEVAAFGEVCASLMQSGVPYVVEDVSIDPRTGQFRDAYEEAAIRSVICVPLHKAGRFTAAMAVHQKEARQWSEGEVNLVRAVVEGCWESLERALGERKLEEASRRLGLALTAADLGDWSWEPDSDVVVFSRRAAEIFGIPMEPPMTWGAMQELLQPEDRARTLLILDEALVRQEQYDVEYRVNRPDGTQVWISAVGRAHYDAGGKPVRMYGVVQDITKRKKLEEQLRTHLAELAAADRKKDEFIALLAHELRNPLAPLRTGLEIIRCSEAGPEVSAKVIGMLDGQVALMTRLIDDLLDVSRITEGKVELKIEPLSVVEVVEELLETLRPQFHSAGLAVELTAPPNVPVINGDRVRLTQVFSNLLTNSIKFTEPGGKVTVEVETSERAVHLAVEDTGQGIASDVLPRIFDKFVQAAPGTAKGGLGLGLSLTRSFVELHGGVVSAESSGIGTGSRFIIELPLGR